MKNNILIVLFCIVFLAISSCSLNKNNETNFVWTSSPIDIRESINQPNY